MRHALIAAASLDILALVPAVSFDSWARAVSKASTVDVGPPLVGAAYAHWATFGCSADRAGIIRTYDQPGVRRQVRPQLAAMRAAGLDSLLLLLWHETDPDGQEWGVVPSAGGRLVELYRSNLINYLSDVRAADFRSLTVDFGPESSNDPVGFRSDCGCLRPGEVRGELELHPRRAAAGEAVRTALDAHRPAERGGAPTSYHPESLQRIKDYIREIYRRYVDAFGNSDVTVSAIAAPEPNEDITRPDGSHRLQNLIDAFAASGRGEPTFFSIHVTTPWHPSFGNTLYGLRQADATLTANDLSQPLIVSETAYDDKQLAAAIATFRRTSSRAILEVQEWPWRSGSACKDFSVAPPFRADAYIIALTGSPPSSRLTACGCLYEGGPAVKSLAGGSRVGRWW